MASDIFKSIIEQKIDTFASTFGDNASNIFTHNNKIFHPLEYGMYKEKCAKELLSFTTGKDIGIADGFAITSKNCISTQCDILMYKKDTLPLIDNGIAKFFPIEIIRGIGEVKSTLNKSQFANALEKLAKNKMMYEERTGRLKSERRTFKENDEIFSFLICNKLSFDVSELDFDEVYRDIPKIEYRHNAILSLQDGLLTYKLNFAQLPIKQKENFIKKGGNINSQPVIWYYPHHSEDDECYICEKSFIEVNSKDKYSHIIYFLIIIKALLEDSYEYDFDFVEYLAENKVKIFN